MPMTSTARRIAHALKASSAHSSRRKASAFQSAMSMLTCYENRAGKNLSSTRRTTLERAKEELRRLFGHPPVGRA
jgi:predicted nucleic acid-binding protein